MDRASCPCANPDVISPADYEIYRPDYISSSTSPTFTRPVIEPLPLPDPIPANWKGDITLEYGQVEKVYYSAEGDVIIDRVVLMRPGSVTHHADTNQRCVNLNFERDVEPGTNRSFVRVAVPSLASNLLPRGIYMMFLVSSQTVTTQGVPSEAVWVEVK